MWHPSLPSRHDSGSCDCIETCDECEVPLDSAPGAPATGRDRRSGHDSGHKPRRSDGKHGLAHTLHLPDLHLGGNNGPTVNRAMRSMDRILHPHRRSGRPHPQAIVIGSSTGGPDALQDLLESIDPPLAVPMFIVQHMPAKFTRELARRLTDRVATQVVEAEAGTEIRPGVCYVAPGGRHMTLRRVQSGGVVVALNDDEPINSCRPSVEPLFESAGRVFGEELVAVMLTGMGRDGADASVGLAELGCPILVQDKESSVVWGMPGAIVEAGLASEVLPLSRIGRRLAVMVESGWPPIRQTHRSHATKDHL